MALIWKKRANFVLLFSPLVASEKTQKFLQHISHLPTYTYFAHPIDFFALPNLPYEYIMYVFSLVRLLVLIFIRAILEQSMNNKI